MNPTFDFSRVRMVALDLDGTLLRRDGSVSARTLTTLKMIQDAGILLALVTARPPRRLREIAQRTGIRGLAICSNGAVVYDLTADRIEQQNAILVEHAHALVTGLRAVLPGVAFAIEAGARYGCEPHYAIPGEHSDDSVDAAMLRADALTLCELGATKLIVQHEASELLDLLRSVRELAGELSVTHSGSNFVEVAAVGTTKAVALALLCERHGIAAGEVVAFGDMPNDLPMLTWAGHSVAVANAHAEVLAVVHSVTASNDEDGVARSLEEFFLQR